MGSAGLENFGKVRAFWSEKAVGRIFVKPGAIVWLRRVEAFAFVVLMCELYLKLNHEESNKRIRKV